MGSLGGKGRKRREQVSPAGEGPVNSWMKTGRGGSPGLATDPLSLSDLDSQPHMLGKRRACPPGLPAPASSLQGQRSATVAQAGPSVRAEEQGSGNTQEARDFSELEPGVSRSLSQELFWK